MGRHSGEASCPLQCTALMFHDRGKAKTKSTMLLLHDTSFPSIDFCVSMRLFLATYEELLENPGWIGGGIANVSLSYLI